jgi:hypothetical protein
MKKATMITGIALMIIFASTLLVSFKPKDEKQNAKLFKDLREQLIKFAKSDVFPEMKKWKEELDNSLSKEDLQTLNELRKKASVLRENAMKQRKEMHEKRIKGEDTDDEAIEDQMMVNMNEFKKLGKEVKPIAEKNLKTLKSIGEKAKPKIEDWKEKGKNIVQSWMKEHKDELQEFKGKHPEKRFLKRFEWLRNLDDESKRKIAVVKFMLWDGNENIFDEE